MESPRPCGRKAAVCFLLRPLLGVRRADLRERLRRAGETWLEDPANDDPRHPRVRARLRLAGGGDPLPEVSAAPPCLDDVTIDPAGEIVFGARASRPPFLGQALLCASGSPRPPRRDRLERLLARIAAAEPFTATLAGARIECGGGVVRIAREAGDIARGGAALRPLRAGEPIVWDGRFEITARIEGLAVAPLSGLAARLDRSQRAALCRLAPAARKAAPAIVDRAGRVTALLLGQDEPAGVRSLIAERFLGACGAIVSEHDARLRSENVSDTLNRVPTAMRRVHEPA